MRWEAWWRERIKGRWEKQTLWIEGGEDWKVEAGRRNFEVVAYSIFC